MREKLTTTILITLAVILLFAIILKAGADKKRVPAKGELTRTEWILEKGGETALAELPVAPKRLRIPDGGTRIILSPEDGPDLICTIAYHPERCALFNQEIDTGVSLFFEGEYLLLKGRENRKTLSFFHP